jgi:hypothetical protein
MNSFEAYIMYRAMKLHFTSPTYDFHKYNGRVSGKPETFERRKDRYMFSQLSKRDNPQNLLVAVLSDNPKAWIGDVLHGDDIAFAMQKKHESLTYLFEQDIAKLSDNLKYEVTINDDQYPPLLNDLLNEAISKETLIILDDVLGFLPYWRERIEDSLYFPDVDFKLSKYRRFFPQYNKQKIIDKMKKRWPNQLTL